MGNVDSVMRDGYAKPVAEDRRPDDSARDQATRLTDCAPTSCYVLSAATGSCTTAPRLGAPCRRHRPRRRGRVRPRDYGLVRPKLGRSPPAAL